MANEEVLLQGCENVPAELLKDLKASFREVAAVWLHNDTTKKHAAIIVEVPDDGFYNFVAEVEDTIQEIESLASHVPESLKAALRDNVPGGGPHRLSVYISSLRGTGVAQVGATLIAAQPRASAAGPN